MDHRQVLITTFGVDHRVASDGDGDDTQVEVIQDLLELSEALVADVADGDPVVHGVDVGAVTDLGRDRPAICCVHERISFLANSR